MTRQGAKHGPVLVIDDDPDILESLGDVLRMHGFAVVTATNGVQALERAREDHPCMILLDLMMPRMNGEQFLDAQRADPQLVSVPTVVVTAKRQVSAETRGQVMEVLPKPIDLDRLLAIIALHC